MRRATKIAYTSIYPPSPPTPPPHPPTRQMEIPPTVDHMEDQRCTPPDEKEPEDHKRKIIDVNGTAATPTREINNILQPGGGRPEVPTTLPPPPLPLSLFPPSLTQWDMDTNDGSKMTTKTTQDKSASSPTPTNTDIESKDSSDETLDSDGDTPVLASTSQKEENQEKK